MGSLKDAVVKCFRARFGVFPCPTPTSAVTPTTITPTTKPTTTTTNANITATPQLSTYTAPITRALRVRRGIIVNAGRRSAPSTFSFAFALAYAHHAAERVEFKFEFKFEWCKTALESRLDLAFPPRE